MRWLIWVVFALVMLLWTAAVFVGTQVLGWAAGLLSSGQEAAAVTQAVQNFPWPAWLAVWVDPVWLQHLAAVLTQSWAWLTAVLPAFATVVGWLVPLAWVAWAVVALGLLAVAVGLHVVSGRIGRPGGSWQAWLASVRGSHGR